jgi:hypothetical protein
MNRDTIPPTDAVCVVLLQEPSQQPDAPVCKSSHHDCRLLRLSCACVAVFDVIDGHQIEANLHYAINCWDYLCVTQKIGTLDTVVLLYFPHVGRSTVMQLAGSLSLLCLTPMSFI